MPSCIRMYVVCVSVFGALVVPAAAQKLKIDVPIGELESRAKRDSNDAAAHYNLAVGYWSAKRFDEAERALRAAIVLDPRFPQPYVGLGYLPYAKRPRLNEDVWNGRVPEEWRTAVDEASTMLRRAFVLDPFVEQRLGGTTRQRSTDFLVELEEFYGEHIRDYFDALDHFYTGEDQKAFDRFQRVYNFVDGDRHPDRLFDNLIWAHGVSAGRLKKWKEAKWDFDLLLERSRKAEAKRRDSLVFVPLRTNELVYIQGLLQQRLGEPDDALRLYREAIENDIGLFVAHVRIAEIYEGAQRWLEAIDARRNAVNANPDDPTLQLDLGWTMAKAGRLEEAEVELRQAAERAPRDPRAPYYLGLVQQRLNKPADARTNFQRFVQIAPSRFERQIADAKLRLENPR